MDGHIYELEDTSLKELFEKDPDRFGKYHLTHGEILVDFFKNLVTDKTMKLLYELAAETDVKDAVEKNVYRRQNKPYRKPSSTAYRAPQQKQHPGIRGRTGMLCRKSTPCWKR